MKIVNKLWGVERWLHNDKDYCCKILELNPGFQCSLHYHPKKRETFTVVEGRVGLEVVRGFRIGNHQHHVYNLLPYQHITLEPYTPHRFWAIESPAKIVESSTRHDDRDVVRLEDSRERK